MENEAAVTASQETTPSRRAKTKPQASATATAIEAGHKPESHDIIDFNRSRDKRDTTPKQKTTTRVQASKTPSQEIESQSERDAFARNFRVLRKEAGLSQRDIQKLTGIAQSHVSEIESAMHNICIETMVKLAKLVKRPIHELLKP